MKEKPILVITGNPPYSGHSRNNGPVAKGRIDRYKMVWETDANGHEAQKPLGEKNSKWLQDDYVKFIAFAEEKMMDAPEGVVGIITNHSFLDNPTFRGMRQSLMRTFDQIRVIDLHGNGKKKEVSPDGSKDENVFDIEQGVAISLLIKKPGIERGVWRGDVWGKRQEKYEWGTSASLGNATIDKLHPVSPMCIFKDRGDQDEVAYNRLWGIADLLPIKVLGYQIHRDHFAVSIDKETIEARVADFQDEALSDEGLSKKYALIDNRDWRITTARAMMAGNAMDRQIQRTTYRPFDSRWCLFDQVFMDYPRRELLDHVANRQNLQLLLPRQIGTAVWRHSFIADEVAESCAVSNRSREGNYNFPLYLYSPKEGARQSLAMRDLYDEGHDPFAGKDRIENIAPEFRTWIDARYGKTYTPEQILGCIYAILHAPAYRARYADFLRTDFPRIPFPEQAKDFEALTALGWDLVQAHLIKAVPKRELGAYRGKGDNLVGKPRYSPTERAVWINDANHFTNVPQAVWDFTIGGYQVIDKYLKSRKGRTLSLDEIENVENVVNILDFTIEQMSQIDDAYLEAFGEGHTKTGPPLAGRP